ncbi:unnamed protein product [Effrenium voratum]|nr:unnamed protein product [Effrenium voratum]
MGKPAFAVRGPCAAAGPGGRGSRIAALDGGSPHVGAAFAARVVRGVGLLRAALLLPQLDGRHVMQPPAAGDVQEHHRRSGGLAPRAAAGRGRRALGFPRLAGRHLQRAHGFAFQELLRWSGPHSIEAGRRPDRAAADHRDVYFCNLATGECSRENPHAMLDFELRQRRSLLSRCLAAFPPSKSEGASQGSTDAEEGSEREMSPAIRVFAPDSKPHLVLPPRGLSGCLSQASQRAYGDESCKSQASFYSATSAEEDPERPSLASGEPGAFVTAC